MDFKFRIEDEEENNYLILPELREFDLSLSSGKDELYVDVEFNHNTNSQGLLELMGTITHQEVIVIVSKHMTLRVELNSVWINNGNVHLGFTSIGE